MPGHYAPVPRLCERLLPCCQTCHPISLSVPQSQHSITGGSNTVSLTLTPLSLFLSLSHSLTAISCTSEHHLFSSTAQFHLCLLPVDYCGTVARWLRSCRSANVTTSVRPSIGEIVASLSLFQRKDWRRRRKTERGGGMEGKERRGPRARTARARYQGINFVPIVCVQD